MNRQTQVAPLKATSGFQVDAASRTTPNRYPAASVNKTSPIATIQSAFLACCGSNYDCCE